jgi:hypothetical protein
VIVNMHLCATTTGLLAKPRGSCAASRRQSSHSSENPARNRLPRTEAWLHAQVAVYSYWLNEKNEVKFSHHDWTKPCRDAPAQPSNLQPAPAPAPALRAAPAPAGAPVTGDGNAAASQASDDTATPAAASTITSTAEDSGAASSVPGNAGASEAAEAVEEAKQDDATATARRVVYRQDSAAPAHLSFDEDEEGGGDADAYLDDAEVPAAAAEGPASADDAADATADSANLRTAAADESTKQPVQD